MTNMPPEPKIHTDQLPHRRMEAWKWTDVQGKTVSHTKGLAVAGAPKFAPPEGVLVTKGNGPKPLSAMGKLAQIITAESWCFEVSNGQKPDQPLLIEGLIQGHHRVSLTLGKNAALTLIEYHKGSSGGFANIDMHIHLSEEAHLTRIIFQQDPEDHVRVATASVTAETGAQFDQYALSFGGALTRLETRLTGKGEAVEANVNGAYLLDGARHTDMTSHIELEHPSSIIRQAVKGVVSDKAHGVFQGKFHVHRAAQFTDAEMRHDALMLSDSAEVRAKPELEIYADDVACAHGNTIGALDESALFYMRQRGIPAAQARALLTEAFVMDVFDDMTDESLKESLLTQVRDWLS